MPIQEHSLLAKVKHPSRYIGNEINSIKKDPSIIDVSIALAFPDVYEVGMSHHGLKILYKILNRYEWLAAERVFSPWTDMEKELRDRKIPLTTLESDRPLKSFDMIGFSLQHELSFSNVLTILDLSGIPFLCSERDDTFPLIIAGGPACFNPEPVADIFDAILIGDGEDAALEICRVVREYKSERLKKFDILNLLKGIRGVYIPSLFRPHYSSQGHIDYIEPLDGDYKEVLKAVVPDIDKYPFPDDQVIPYPSLVHDRLAVEIARGCTRGCRFCQAGMIYRPVRERSPGSIIKNLEKGLKKTGFEEISLLSLSSGDYSCIAPLIKELMDRHSGDKIAVSLPSLRIDSLDSSWLKEIKRVRKTGFTLAPEAGNDRLRKIINKTLSDKDLMTMARDLYRAGWNLIKLYFMIGLPLEEEDDILDIIRLSKRVTGLAGGRGRKEVLNVSVSTFVPKAHTPFTWVPQVSYEESMRRIKIIRDGLRGNPIHVKWNQPELSWLEGIFSRGDRRLNRALIEAWRQGARFDAWAEHFKIDLWKDAFQRSGIETDFYLYRTRSVDETLPWDHIKSGVSKEYLLKEWKMALEGKITPDCRDKCLNCGACDHKDIDLIIHKDFDVPAEDMASEICPDEDIRKYRLSFYKTGQASYLSHLELARLFMRAFRRAGLNMVFSKGYHPMPKISFVSALPVGTESIHETVDIKLHGPVPLSKLKNDINLQLPEGIKINLVEDISGTTKKERLLESYYRIIMGGIGIDRAFLERFKNSNSFPILKKTKEGEREVNAKALVKSIAFLPPDKLEMTINHIRGPEIRPALIIKEIFGLSDKQIPLIKILKIKQVIG